MQKRAGISNGLKSKDKLEIHTLGWFSVSLGKQLVTAGCGRFNKSWELLLYLITNRQKTTPVEVIHEAIWPDEDCPDPKRDVVNLVHRLRKNIDHEKGDDHQSNVLYAYGSYCWNKSASYWLDVEAFEHLCADARNLVEKSPQQAIYKYKKALDLYRGDYLSEFTGYEWIIPARRYYHQLYVRSILDLIKIYKANQNHSEIARVCEKTFLIEQFDEDIHLHYLEALVAEGKMAQAKSHYQYVTALLYHEFGNKPSGAFQRIYRSIKSSDDDSEIDFSSFRKMIDETESADGALCCDVDSFVLMSRLEYRRAKREGSPLLIASITITRPDYRLPPPVALQEAMDILKRLIATSLRSGDYFSRWNESQYVILFRSINVEAAEKILDRIAKKAGRLIENTNVVMRSSIYPFPSP